MCLTDALTGISFIKKKDYFLEKREGWRDKLETLD